MTHRIESLNVDRYKQLLLSLILIYCIINTLEPFDEPKSLEAISKTYASIRLKWKSCEYWRGPQLGFTVNVFDGFTGGMVGTYPIE